MHEVFDRIVTGLQGIWRYRWPALIGAWLVAAAGWAVVWKLPPVYRAEAKIQVDTDSLLRPLLTGLAIQVDLKSRLQMMTRVMLSRPNLEKLARSTDLDLSVKNAAEKEDLLETLGKKIKIESTRNQDFYTISYEATDPKVAHRVVQALLTVFVDNTLGDKRVDSNTATRFLDQQIQDYEARLRAAEDRLEEFKKANVAFMSESDKTYFQRLEEAQAGLKEAKLHLEEEQRRAQEIRRQLNGERPVFGLGVPASSFAGQNSLDARIQSLYSKLDELRLQYTDQHPDVVSLRDTIAALEKQKKDEAAALSAAGASTVLAPEENPVYQQMRISLAQAEANAASLQVRVRDYEQRVAELRRMVNTVPEVEAQFQRLNRDYAIQKKNYDELVARRETARISENAAQSGDSIQFRVVDPPRVPLEASGPPRLLLSSGVLFAAVGAGIGISLLLSRLRPVFFGRREVGQVLGLPVLGAVSQVWTDAQLKRRRRGRVVFSACIVMMLIVYGGLMAFYALGPLIPIDHL
jgi:polysaccharide chain length determinant protein (PEP-CTERM system associated)